MSKSHSIPTPARTHAHTHACALAHTHTRYAMLRLLAYTRDHAYTNTHTHILARVRARTHRVCAIFSLCLSFFCTLCLSLCLLSPSLCVFFMHTLSLSLCHTLSPPTPLPSPPIFLSPLLIRGQAVGLIKDSRRSAVRVSARVARHDFPRRRGQQVLIEKRQPVIDRARS